MIFNTLTTAAIILVLASHAARAHPASEELVGRLLKDYGTYDETYRGGSGDKVETWIACGSRDYAAALLGRFGLDLSRFSAAPSARLSHLSFKATGLFQPSADWRQRGL